jgi:hypothetical protein
VAEALGCDDADAALDRIGREDAVVLTLDLRCAGADRSVDPAEVPPHAPRRASS